jgi:hypothetical protein
MTDMLDSEMPLRQRDIQALHDELLQQLVMQGAAPSGRREAQAFLLLTECIQLLGAAAINLNLSGKGN